MDLEASTLEKIDARASEISINRYVLRQPVLNQWAKQLKKIAKKADRCKDHWDTVGRGLIVISPDKSELRDFLMMTAGELDGQYLDLDLEKFLACSETLSQETLPTIVLLTPDDWLYRSAEAAEYKSLRSQVVESLRSLSSSFAPVVIVSYAKSYESIAECFRYRGVFDRHIHWAAPKPLLIAADFIDQVGPALFAPNLLAQRERLGRLLSIEFPSSRRLGMLVAATRRRATFESRKIDWRDLIQVCINGTGEGDDDRLPFNFANLAVHEAGHAVVYIVSENLKAVPDMVTIMSSDCALGASVDSYDRTYEIQHGNQTFSDICKKIRILLAGRAAEELCFGIDGCGAYGSQNDLESASSLAIHLIMKNGFPGNWLEDRSGGSNLFSIPDDSELGETQFYDAQLRYFLETLYTQTKDMLAANHALFKVVCNALETKRVLMREDIEELLDNFDQTRSQRSA